MQASFHTVARHTYPGLELPLRFVEQPTGDWLRLACFKLVTGKNKLCPDLESAIARVKHRVAPANAARLSFDTPCARTGRCVDCAAEGRICNVWTITERPFPAGWIHVVLIDGELGL